MTGPGGRPCIYVVAGPNGAGKTTFARMFLPSFADCDEFVNAGRGIRNFFGPYAAVFDTWTVIDNSTPDPRIVAFHDGSDLCVVEPGIFAAMRKEGVSS